MTVLGRNVRLGRDEIDVVAFDPLDRVVAFVEVKTRTRGEHYRPELNMTSKKRSRMLRAARRWVSDHGYDGGYRLDAAYVSDSRVEYVVDLDPMENG
jgi:putative endonuclease